MNEKKLFFHSDSLTHDGDMRVRRANYFFGEKG